MKQTTNGDSERPGGDERKVADAIWRGFLLRCPRCGQGCMFVRFLKVIPNCATCGEALHNERADDAPPYVTIVIVGHIVIPLVLLVERHFSPQMMVHWILWLPLTLVLTLLFLPRVKGALVGLQWGARMHGFGGGRDALGPDP